MILGHESNLLVIALVVCNMDKELKWRQGKRENIPIKANTS